MRTERTSGRYVTEDTNLIEQLRAAAAHDIAADFLEKMRSIGLHAGKGGSPVGALGYRGGRTP